MGTGGSRRQPRRTESRLRKAPTIDTARQSGCGFQDPHPRCSPLQAWDGAWGSGVKRTHWRVCHHFPTVGAPVVLGRVLQGNLSQCPQTPMGTLGRVLAAGVRDSGCGDSGGGRRSPGGWIQAVGQNVTPPGPGRLAGQLPRGQGAFQMRSRRAFPPG